MSKTDLENFLELEEHNKELEKRIKEEVEKNRAKDKVMFYQSKLASMGEMLNNISHQWRQPLMELSSLFLPIEAKISMGIKIENDEILKSIEKYTDIVKYMSETIDDFRNFFANEKEKIEFEIIEQINSTVNIISGSLKRENIQLDIIIKNNAKMVGYKNEYSQVLINIINNARDVLVQRKIKKPRITITIEQIKNNIITSVEDNAGGIEIRPIQKVFDPFFTYDKINGTGIGLFMSKLIVEKNMNGRLFVDNTKNGALFKMTIPKA